MKAYCAECKKETNHNLLVENSRKEYVNDDPNEAWGEYRWAVYECMGCNHVTFLKEDYYSEDIEYDEDDNMVFEPYRTVFYPSEISIDKELLVQQTYLNIPNDINNLYVEIIKAYNSKSYVLVAIGIRTLLEAILNEKKTSGDKLYEKINNAQFIPSNIRENLHAFRFIGNAATHELDIPDKYDLIQSIEIIQDILNISYSLDYKSTLLFNKIKGRKSKV
jgi:uncharacterized protein DUF4145